jgi:hypothetical protein
MSRARHRVRQQSDEVIVVVSGQILHDVVQDDVGWMCADVIFEKPAEDMPIMIGGATGVDFAGGGV